MHDHWTGCDLLHWPGHDKRGSNNQENVVSNGKKIHSRSSLNISVDPPLRLESDAKRFSVSSSDAIKIPSMQFPAFFPGNSAALVASGKRLLRVLRLCTHAHHSYGWRVHLSVRISSVFWSTFCDSGGPNQKPHSEKVHSSPESFPACEVSPKMPRYEASWIRPSWKQKERFKIRRLVHRKFFLTHS